MKTYYFEDHIKISDHKPVEGYVEAYNGENKIFEGHNLVVNSGRKLIKDYVMRGLYLFYGNSNEATKPSTDKTPDNSSVTCKIPFGTEPPNNELSSNNISITITDDGVLVTLNIVITPTMGSSYSI